MTATGGSSPVGGALNLAVLDAGEATDADLEALWAKHARPQTARG